jgi:hypothetical protein
VGEIFDLYKSLDLDPSFLGSKSAPTSEIELLIEYLNFRADTVESSIRPLLMNRDEAKAEFEKIWDGSSKVGVHLPMNKQKGDKSHYSYRVRLFQRLSRRAVTWAWWVFPEVPAVGRHSAKPGG